MIINTNYDIGSEVWFSKGFHKPLRGTVIALDAFVDLQQISIRYTVDVEGGGSTSLKEGQCFDSAEAVIDDARRQFEGIIATMSEPVATAASESNTLSNESDSSH